MKKKVVLYGVRQVELRRDVEFFLDDYYQIVGYSDSYYPCDVLDGKPFLRLEELAQSDFDYIILLTYLPNTFESMKKGLLKQGVPEEKVVSPVLFYHHNKEKCQLDILGDFYSNYHNEAGLIFGLSYSLRGIYKKELQIPFYDLSWHGLDLYYCYRLFANIQENELTNHVKRIILAFPYDFLNYDMSRTMFHYEYGTIFSLWRLDDWHHYRDIPNGADYVANYRMFGKKITEFYHFDRYEQENHGVYSGEDGVGQLGHTWKVRHEETIEENRMILRDFLKTLSDNEISTDFIVPPFYLTGLDEESKRAFYQTKELFYRELDAVRANRRMRVFDYAELYDGRRELFADLTHLNSAGAHEFTKQINHDALSD